MPETTSASPVRRVTPSFLRWLFRLVIWSLLLAAVWGEESLPVEDLVESEQERFDPGEVLEYLQALRQCPLDPNKATFSQLEQIPYLSALQIRGILKARQKGKFLRLEDLLRAEGMDPQTLTRLRPFFRIRTSKGLRGHLRSRAAWTLPLSRGYQQGQFWGDPAGVYIRLHLSADDRLWAGVLAEKDPGEPDLADYRSFFLQLVDLGPVRKLLLGDFVLEFGQGLVLWTAGSSSAGIRNLADLKKNGRGIRPYTSTEENTGLRGAALSGLLGPLSLDLFASRTHLDATRQNGVVTSLFPGGYHRTTNEMEKKDALQETLLGGHLYLHLAEDKKLGLTWYRCAYRPPLEPSDVVRQRYALRGSSHQVLGGDLDVVLGSIDLFGEVAIFQALVGEEAAGEVVVSAAAVERATVDKAAASAVAMKKVSGSPAAVGDQRPVGAVAGLRMDRGPFSAGVLWRQYAAGFHSSRGSAPAARDDQNEHGLLAAFHWKAARGTDLGLIAEGFQRPWRTYTLEMSSFGHSWTIQAAQRLARDVSVTLRLKWRGDQVASVATDGLKRNLFRRTRGHRFQVDWKVNEELELRSRLEISRIGIRGSGTGQRGTLLQTQMKISLGHEASLRTAIAFFRIPSYDGRIYLCEVGPSGVARNVALFGRGSRAFLLLNRTVIKDLQISFRYGTTLYRHCCSMGSGLDQIDHHVKHEFMIQLDWRW